MEGNPLLYVNQGSFKTRLCNDVPKPKAYVAAYSVIDYGSVNIVSIFNGFFARHQQYTV